jgi:hypothetical protein
VAVAKSEIAATSAVAVPGVARRRCTSSNGTTSRTVVIM